MSQTLDRPDLIYRNPAYTPDLDPTLDLSDDSGWPESVLLIQTGTGLYACVDSTTVPPDPMHLKGLCCFMDKEEANLFRATPHKGITGKIVTKTLDEAREIAKSKPMLQALFLMKGATVWKILNIA